MKKLIRIIIIIAILLGGLIVASWGDRYTIEAECILVNREVATFVDTYNGDYWIWYASEKETFTEGSIYEITAHKGQLQSCEDDVILKIKEVK